jgi:hypothetical protein
MKLQAVLTFFAFMAIPCLAAGSFAATLDGPAGVDSDAVFAAPAGPSADLVLISSLDARTELLALTAAGASGGSAGASHDPPKMMFLSLAVPGAGQLVQGEKRGYLYLLFEVAMWGGFYYLDQQGLEERSDYEDFVVENWNLAGYLEFFEEHCLDDPQDYANGCRPLAPEGSQEFYEDVGKYDVYWPWWSGDGAPNDVTADDMAVRDEYWGMRMDSNAHLRQARYFMMAALLNHVASALDSFLIARSSAYGAAPIDLGLEFGVPEDAVGLTCALVAQY